MIYSEIKDDANSFLEKYGLYLALGIVIVIICVALIIIFVALDKKKKKSLDNSQADDWLKALGGKENLIETSATGSRLTIKLNNPELINKDVLKELGVSNIVTMSDKIVLVIENKAEQIKEKLN